MIAANAGFGTADLECGGQHAEQPVRLFARQSDRGAQRLLIILHLRAFQPHLQAGEGRAQIMRQPIGYNAQFGNQRLNAFEHGVECGGQPVKRIAAAIQPDALRQLACAHGLGGFANIIDARIDDADRRKGRKERQG